MDAQNPNMAQMPQQMMQQPMQAMQMQQPMASGGLDTDGFSAKPKLIQQKNKFRDPYREYM